MLLEAFAAGAGSGGTGREEGCKLSEQEEQRHVSHVARNPEAVGAKRDRLALCGRVIPARALTVQASAENCCAKCRKAWLARWRQEAA
jgi:hypothetical protein